MKNEKLNKFLERTQFGAENYVASRVIANVKRYGKQVTLEHDGFDGIEFIDDSGRGIRVSKEGKAQYQRDGKWKSFNGVNNKGYVVTHYYIFKHNEEGYTYLYGTTIYLHTLVAWVFMADEFIDKSFEEGKQVACHIDALKTHCSLDNIEFGTLEQNRRQAVLVKALEENMPGKFTFWVDRVRRKQQRVGIISLGLSEQTVDGRYIALKQGITNKQVADFEKVAADKGLVAGGYNYVVEFVAWMLDNGYWKEEQ